MWSLRTAPPIVAAILCLAALAGCGFRPLHSTESRASSANLAEITIAPIPDRVGQQLRNRLRDEINPLGTPSSPRYVLSVKLSESLQNLAVRKDEVATRANLILRANFQLTRLHDRAVVMSSNAVSANSYNILSSDFATLSAENDARARAVSEISDDIKARVSVFLTSAR